ncbi:hypothetical protein [Hyphococcus luteus]|uniref:hypothetical protein n=1 Tax=Hyphococcus luteus TaxID=2058213 RepID=UPI001057354D|nr:hypothetical protein [Marinicaulis flavus]
MKPELLKHFAPDQRYLRVESLSESYTSPLAELIRYAAFGAVISPYEESDADDVVNKILQIVAPTELVTKEVIMQAHATGVRIYIETERYAKQTPVISIPILVDEVSPESVAFAFDLADFTFTQGFMKNFIRDDSEIQNLRGRKHIVALCYQQLSNALSDFRLEKRNPEQYVVGIEHLTEGINILAATIKNPRKAIIYDA